MKQLSSVLAQSPDSVKVHTVGADKKSPGLSPLSSFFLGLLSAYRLIGLVLAFVAKLTESIRLRGNFPWRQIERVPHDLRTATQNSLIGKIGEEPMGAAYSRSEPFRDRHCQKDGGTLDSFSVRNEISSAR